MSSQRTTVAVLFGGRSSEHSVSCVSAAGVIGALDLDRYRPVPIGITKNGTWVTVEDPTSFSFADGAMPEVEENGSAVFVSPSTRGVSLLERAADGSVRDLGDIDVFFPVLHGQFGEDGTLQGLLELKGVPFVGPGVLTSAVGMDKHFMKTVLRSAGIPTADWQTVTAKQWADDPAGVRERLAALGLPVFVKPARAGSSVGISKVAAAEDLDAALREGFEHDHKVIVEPGIDGREIECAVLGSHWDDELTASVPGEIVISGDHEFYDFEAKYLSADDVRLQAPADIPDDVARTVQAIAADTFCAFECSGLTRVDTFVQADGTVLVNEINTSPGFTPTSGYPHMMGKSGIDYPELISRLIDIATVDVNRR